MHNWQNVHHDNLIYVYIVKEFFPLVNTLITSYIYLVYVCVTENERERTFKFYNLSKFELYNTKLSIIVTMLYISLRHDKSYSWKFVSFSNLFLIPLPGVLGNHFYIFCNYELDFILILHISDTMYYMFFLVWLISFSIILSWSIHVVTCDRISVFSMPQ